MVTELANRGRWCALDSLKVAQNYALIARTCSHRAQYVHLCVSPRSSAIANRFGVPELPSILPQLGSQANLRSLSTLLDRKHNRTSRIGELAH